MILLFYACDVIAVVAGIQFLSGRWAPHSPSQAKWWRTIGLASAVAIAALGLIGILRRADLGGNHEFVILSAIYLTLGTAYAAWISWSRSMPWRRVVGGALFAGLIAINLLPSMIFLVLSPLIAVSSLGLSDRSLLARGATRQNDSGG
jgi:hypothetical protein